MFDNKKCFNDNVASLMSEYIDHLQRAENSLRGLSDKDKVDVTLANITAPIKNLHSLIIQSRIKKDEDQIKFGLHLFSQYVCGQC